MPQLDVSCVLSDPMLADRFYVTRRAEAIGDNGRSSLTLKKTGPYIGVITQGDPAKLVRSDDSQHVPRVISLVSKTKTLHGAIQGYQPDIISWAGTDYLVTDCLPYHRFGAGFYETTAQSMAASDTKQ